MLFSLRNLRNSLAVVFLLPLGVYAAQYTPIDGTTSAENTDTINRSLNDLFKTKLDLRPTNILPLHTDLYTLGNSYYKWLGLSVDTVTTSSLVASTITVTSATITNLSNTSATITTLTNTSLVTSTITASSATITQITASSITLTNLKSLFKLKVGSFVGSGSSGNQSVSGVGFKPRLVVFLMGGADATTWLLSIGATDGTNMFVTGGRTDDGGLVGGYTPNTSLVIRHISTAGASITDGSFVSFDVDGFTISWTVATTLTTGYIAIQ